jgi:hypothetical protein
MRHVGVSSVLHLMKGQKKRCRKLIQSLNGLISYIFYVLVALAASLYVLNRVKPAQSETRVQGHCLIGFTAFVVGSIYIYFVYTGLDWFKITTIGLLVSIVVTGSILKYLHGAGSIRFHSSSLHPALVLSLIIILMFSILKKI